MRNIFEDYVKHDDEGIFTILECQFVCISRNRLVMSLQAIISGKKNHISSIFDMVLSEHNIDTKH